MSPHDLAVALRTAPANTVAAAIWSCDKRRRNFILRMARKLPKTVRSRQARASGRLGGIKSMKALTPEQRSEKARHAARSRWWDGYSEPLI